MSYFQNNHDMKDKPSSIEYEIREALVRTRDIMERSFRHTANSNYHCGMYDAMLEIAFKMAYPELLPNIDNMSNFEMDVFPHLRYHKDNLNRTWSSTDGREARYQAWKERNSSQRRG